MQNQADRKPTMKIRNVNTTVLVILSLALTMLGQSAMAGQSKNLKCPYGDHPSFKSYLQQAVIEENTFPMWAVLVNRSGKVCMVAFSGESYDSQFLVSRQIAAAKAFPANGFAMKNKCLNCSLGR